jgi:hypothetical protein
MARTVPCGSSRSSRARASCRTSTAQPCSASGVACAQHRPPRHREGERGLSARSMPGRSLMPRQTAAAIRSAPVVSPDGAGTSLPPVRDEALQLLPEPFPLASICWRASLRCLQRHRRVTVRRMLAALTALSVRVSDWTAGAVEAAILSRFGVGSVKRLGLKSAIDRDLRQGTKWFGIIKIDKISPFPRKWQPMASDFATGLAPLKTDGEMSPAAQPRARRRRLCRLRGPAEGAVSDAAAFVAARFVGARRRVAAQRQGKPHCLTSHHWVGRIRCCVPSRFSRPSPSWAA